MCPLDRELIQNLDFQKTQENIHLKHTQKKSLPLCAASNMKFRRSGEKPQEAGNIQFKTNIKINILNFRKSGGGIKREEPGASQG